MKKIIIISAVVGTLTAHGAVKLPAYVTDNMIVQQQSKIRIKGEASPSGNVTITPGWDSSRPVSVKADGKGRFVVELQTPAAGGPYSIVFADKDGETRVENLLSGEVWFCSGQSNMEMPVQGWTTVMDYDREIATAYHPDIRLLQVRKRTAFTPQDNIEVNGGGWQICSPASIADYSAIAYFFARELHEKLGVPVGVIDATWGGTPAEAWTSLEALKGVEGFEEEITDMEEARFDSELIKARYAGRVEKWMEMARGEKVDFDKGRMQPEWSVMTAPGYWESTVMPEFDGVVWMQKSINIPERLAGKPLTLNFRAIDDEDQTYFNGTLIGNGSGYDTPRSYTVAAGIVRSGENVITIKVSDFGGEGGIAPGQAEAVIEGERLPLDGEWRYMVETDFSQLPPKPVEPGGSSYPTVLYNAMVAPLADMPVKGTLWYQGCANVGRDRQYTHLFKALIRDWRRQWGEQMPFYFVQLAGFRQPKAVQPDSKWAALRDAQAQALSLDNTGMAVAIDLGNPADIHPKNKRDVAHRLALIALGRDYGGKEAYAAPKCISISSTRDDALVLTFDGPVCPSSSAITGFIIAGKDGRYTTATPIADGDRRLRLSAPGVKNPVSVRYGWADYPCGNLYGSTGLPVAPFTIEK